MLSLFSFSPSFLTKKRGFLLTSLGLRRYGKHWNWNVETHLKIFLLLWNEFVPQEIIYLQINSILGKEKVFFAVENYFSKICKKFFFIKQDLKEFEETILQGVGYDKDGKISKKELTMILLTLAKISPNEQ